MDNKKEGKGFEEFIAKCAVNRLRQLDEIFEASEDFVNAEKEEEELYEELIKDLSEGKKRALSKYDSVSLWKRTMTRIFYYRNGLKDGTALSRVLDEGKENIRLDINIT